MKHDRTSILAMFKLMSKREIDHVVDRAMHALSNCSVVINTPQQGTVRSYDDVDMDANMEFELYYFIITEGLKYSKNSKKKIWMASTPHIQAKHRALTVESQSSLDRRRGRLARAQQQNAQRRARHQRQMEVQARAARHRAQRDRLAAQGNRPAVVASDIESLTPYHSASELSNLLNVPPLRNSTWTSALASLQANHVVPRRVQGTSSVPLRSRHP